MQNLAILLERDVELRVKQLQTLKASSTSLIVGLLIGNRTENFDYVFHLARCPLPDVAVEAESLNDQQDEGKHRSKTTKQQNTISVALDEEWIVHHSRQAARMLPGGFSILGFFAVGDKRQILESQAVLSKTLRSVRRICVEIDGGAFGIEKAGSIGRMLLMNVDVSAKKPTITVVDCSDSRSQSSVAAFNYQKTHFARLTYNLALDFPCVVKRKNFKGSFQSQFISSSTDYFQRLDEACVTFNGRFRDVYESLVEKASKKGASNVVDVDFDVQLFVDDSRCVNTVESEECAVKMYVKGTLAGRLDVPSKISVGDAIRCVKTDILRSIFARVELHNEGMLVVEGEELDPVAFHQFPRRVFAPLNLPGEQLSLSVCDYLFEGDGVDDAVQSMRDVLDSNVSGDMVEDGCEMVPDEEGLKKLRFAQTSSAGGSNPSKDAEEKENGDMKDVSRIEAENRERLARWPILFVGLAFIVGLLSYLIYIFMMGSE